VITQLRTIGHISLLMLMALAVSATTSDASDFVQPVFVPEAPLPQDGGSVMATSAVMASAPAPAKACPPKKKADLAAAVAGAHKPLFYDNDFSYVCNPAYCDWHLGDNLKQHCLGDCISYDIGGQFRMRQHAERHHRKLGLTPNNDDFLLYRTRVYGDFNVGDSFRIYVEGLDAVSNYESIAPRPIEENRFDVQNMFADLKLMEHCRGDLWGRYGRQELLYGAQRTVSPLDWANTRRTFEGGKLFWKGKNWNIDAFWTRPMNVVADRFDTPNYDQEFGGIYGTYKGLENSTVDYYYLRYTNTTSPFDFDTLGMRWAGKYCDWLYEMEAAVQLGEFQGNDHNAGAVTLGLGRKFEDVCWKPAIWLYYDWASGDDIEGNGYHHLFPLAHKYLGFMDLFGRRNIETPNVQFSMKPHKKLTLMLWYYYFFLENQNDVPYTVTMAPYNSGVAPASADLGHEIDLTATWKFTPRTAILFGYSHFFSGDYYKQTPGLTYRGDADFLYTQFTVNF
jgi:alginate export protein